jgi:hypothetical protein
MPQVPATARIDLYGREVAEGEPVWDLGPTGLDNVPHTELESTGFLTSSVDVSSGYTSRHTARQRTQTTCISAPSRNEANQVTSTAFLPSNAELERQVHGT